MTRKCIHKSIHVSDKLVHTAEAGRRGSGVTGWRWRGAEGVGRGGGERGQKRSGERLEPIQETQSQDGGEVVFWGSGYGGSTEKQNNEIGTSKYFLLFASEGKSAL